MDTTVLTIIPPLSNSDQNKSSKPIFRLGQQLRLTRDGHSEIMILTAVDVDITTKIPYYSGILKNGLTKSVTKEYLTHLNEDRLLFIPIIYTEVKYQGNFINPETL